MHFRMMHAVLIVFVMSWSGAAFARDSILQLLGKVDGLPLHPVRGSLLQRAFPGCDVHDNEFERGRCASRRAEFLREALGKTYCSVESAQLGEYDFARKKFPVHPHPNLGDPWDAELAGANVSDPSEESNEFAASPSDTTVIAVSKSKKVRAKRTIFNTFGRWEDPKLSRRKWFPIKDQDTAEWLSLNAKPVTISIFTLQRHWSRTLPSPPECKKLRRLMKRNRLDMFEAAAAEVLCRPQSLLGMKAKLLGRAVVDTESGTVLYSSHEFGPKEKVFEVLDSCGSAFWQNLQNPPPEWE